VPERIYLDRRLRSPRIHIELDAAEIADILDDMPVPGTDAFDATKVLHRILRDANDLFRADHRAQSRD
jgi:hypothetical protein